MTSHDIDAILAEEERVPCTFEIDAIGLGYLDASTVDDDLDQGSKVELPLWMADVLARKGMVKAGLLKCYNQRFLSHLSAGPSGVNLRNYCAYFYRVGRTLAALARDTAESEESPELRNQQLAEAAAINDALRVTFAGERFREILDTSLNSRDEDLSLFKSRLSDTEMRLFRAGMAASQDYYRWRSRQLGTIERSEAMGGKRRRTVGTVAGGTW